jgi:putative phosphoribosyl transferase
VRVVPWIPPLFADREAGGRELAKAIRALGRDDPLVVGVARGGVAVAVEIARALRAPLTAVDVERVNARGLRLGAVTAAGPPYVRPDHGLSDDEVLQAVERARRTAEALERRLELTPATPRGRAAVLVDDGAITGLTLAAACRWARAEHAKTVVAATPVAHLRGLERIRAESDEVVCPHALEQISVVGQAYDSFDPLDEWYVAALLADA